MTFIFPYKICNNVKALFSFYDRVLITACCSQFIVDCFIRCFGLFFTFYFILLDGISMTPSMTIKFYSFGVVVWFLLSFAQSVPTALHLNRQFIRNCNAIIKWDASHSHNMIISLIQFCCWCCWRRCRRHRSLAIVIKYDIFNESYCKYVVENFTVHQFRHAQNKKNRIGTFCCGSIVCFFITATRLNYTRTHTHQRKSTWTGQTNKKKQQNILICNEYNE